MRASRQASVRLGIPYQTGNRIGPRAEVGYGSVRLIRPGYRTCLFGRAAHSARTPRTTDRLAVHGPAESTSCVWMPRGVQRTSKEMAVVGLVVEPWSRMPPPSVTDDDLAALIELVRPRHADVVMATQKGSLSRGISDADRVSTTVASM